jgi:hypothetical protein
MWVERGRDHYGGFRGHLHWYCVVHSWTYVTVLHLTIRLYRVISIINRRTNSSLQKENPYHASILTPRAYFLPLRICLCWLFDVNAVIKYVVFSAQLL